MENVELFENERATGYNQFVETWIPNYHYFLTLLPDLMCEAEQKNLLSIGCGTGNEIAQFVQAPGDWKITGIDPSPDMIRQATETFQNHERVTLIEGLLSDLSLDKKYGAATLLLVLHFLEDNGAKLNLLKEVSKRLHPGAPFVMLDITGNRQQIMQNLNVLRLLLPNALSEVQIHTRLNRIEHELCHTSEERLTELCIEAGFEPPVRFFQSAIYMGWLMKKL